MSAAPSLQDSQDLRYFTSLRPVSDSPLDQAAQEGVVEDQRETEDDKEAGQDGQDDEPEPEEDIYLLIDHIDRKHAETIMNLKYARLDKQV